MELNPFLGYEKLGCIVEGELLQWRLMKMGLSMCPVMGGLLGGGLYRPNANAPHPARSGNQFCCKAMFPQFIHA